MSTPLPTSRIPVLFGAVTLVAVLAACGDSKSGSTTTARPATSAAVSTTGASTSAAPATSAAPDTSTAPATTAASGSTAPLGTKPPGTGTPLKVTVYVGINDGPDNIVEVKVGQAIQLEITNQTADDEFHVHTLDLGEGEKVPKGQKKVFQFTVTQPGDIEVESHTTGTTLVIIRVSA